MEGQLVIAFGSAVLGALLVAILQPLWTNLIQPKSSLLVTVRQYKFDISRYLRDAISEYSAWQWHNNRGIRPQRDTIKKLERCVESKSYFEIDIVNNSNKTIEDVEIHVKNTGTFVAEYEIEGSKKSIFFGELLEIGMLRPNSKCNVLIWPESIYYSDLFYPDKDSIVITAKQFDKIKMRYPLPSGVTRNFILINKTYLFFSFMFIVSFSWIVPLVISKLINMYARSNSLTIFDGFTIAGTARKLIPINFVSAPHPSPPATPSPTRGEGQCFTATAANSHPSHKR
jgi:hypothetical protein